MTYHVRIGGVPSCTSPLTSISIFGHRGIFLVCAHTSRESAEDQATAVRELYEAHGYTFDCQAVEGACEQPDNLDSNMFDDGFQSGLNRALELASDPEALREALIEHGHLHVVDAAQEAAEAAELERQRTAATAVSDAFYKSDEYRQIEAARERERAEFAATPDGRAINRLFG